MHLNLYLYSVSFNDTLAKVSTESLFHGDIDDELLMNYITSKKLSPHVIWEPNLIGAIIIIIQV